MRLIMRPLPDHVAGKDRLDSPLLSQPSRLTQEKGAAIVTGVHGAAVSVSRCADDLFEIALTHIDDGQRLIGAVGTVRFTHKAGLKVNSLDLVTGATHRFKGEPTVEPTPR